MEESGRDAKRVPRIGPYSQAVRVGNLVYTADQPGIDPTTGAVAGDTFEAQARQAFANLRAVLEDTGSGLDRVIKVTCFIADPKAFPALNSLFGALSPSAPPVRSPMTSAETMLTRLFDDLANLVERAPGLSVRIQRADGSEIEGQVVSVSDADFFVLDKATGQHVQVFAHELRALDVSAPRRAREWILAACAVPAVTAALVGYARLPWVDPKRGDIVMGFMILVTIVAGVMSIPFLHKWLQSWLTQWRRLYPPVAL